MKKYLSLKRIQLIKKIAFTQRMEVKKAVITKKSNKLITYIVAILCGTLFYTHQFFPNFSESYYSALNKHKIAKKRRTIALQKVKNYAKGSSEFTEYYKEKKKTDIAWAKFKKIKADEQVFGFKSANLFLERFGLMLCFFVYAFYNLVKSFKRERNNIGSKVLHTFIISVTMFYFFWIFQQFQDFSKATYILMTILSSIVVTIGVWLITAYKKSRVTKLREQMFFIARLALRNSKPEKKEDMLNVFRKIADDK
ncbi:hypothetical protein R5N98_02615 [Tenacibaculum maritimum]|uniref:hypothetical protein n=2 Tax=Tenacibaculum maritimum TaxID=107401 RepID=UPI0038766596